ncbi:MAG: OST-HTH/LOTUS domain-containing protein, partial [Anaerolineae bacterium]|nr:OST-HTH/LOTUS domain-containing protein [Anaerolineae bacterium]
VQDDGWAHLGTFGSSLRQLDPGFDPRTYGHKLLSQLVQADPNFFETQKRASKGGNEVIYIRLKV